MIDILWARSGFALSGKIVITIGTTLRTRTILRVRNRQVADATADLAVGSGSTWTLAGPGTFGGTVQLSGILTVGAGVSITTAAPGVAAVSLNASSAVLTNQGTLTGSAETGTVRGGQGALVGFAKLVNSGLIQGGAASTQARGGVGVSLAAGLVGMTAYDGDPDKILHVDVRTGKNYLTKTAFRKLETF